MRVFAFSNPVFNRSRRRNWCRFFLHKKKAGTHKPGLIINSANPLQCLYKVT